jgi:hypothetical protein
MEFIQDVGGDTSWKTSTWKINTEMENDININLREA